MAGNEKVTANQFHAFLHGTQADMFPGAVFAKQSTWLETTTPVLHFQANFRFLALQSKTDMLSFRMFAHVGKRFLHDAEERSFDSRRQAFWPKRFFKKY